MSTTILRTKDLALATTLRLNGIDFDHMEVHGRNAFWVFTNPIAPEIQAQYDGGKALVEPRAYSRELRRTRSQLFDFLQSHGVPRPTR